LNNGPAGYRELSEMATKRPKPTLKTKIQQWVMDLDRTQGYSFEAVLGRLIDFHQLHSDKSELKKLKSQREKLRKQGEMAASFQVECKIKYLQTSIQELSKNMEMDRQKLIEHNSKKQSTPWLRSLKKRIQQGKETPKSYKSIAIPSILRNSEKGKVHPMDMHVSFAETGIYRVYMTALDEDDTHPQIIVEFHQDSQIDPHEIEEEEEEEEEDYTDSVVPIRFESTFRTSSFKGMSADGSPIPKPFESDHAFKLTPESSIQSFNS
jgi:hypothetical protein